MPGMHAGSDDIRVTVQMGCRPGHRPLDQTVTKAVQRGHQGTSMNQHGGRRDKSNHDPPHTMLEHLNRRTGQPAHTCKPAIHASLAQQNHPPVGCAQFALPRTDQAAMNSQRRVAPAHSWRYTGHMAVRSPALSRCHDRHSAGSRKVRSTADSLKEQLKSCIHLKRYSPKRFVRAVRQANMSRCGNEISRKQPSRTGSISNTVSGRSHASHRAGPPLLEPAHEQNTDMIRHPANLQLVALAAAELVRCLR